MESPARPRGSLHPYLRRFSYSFAALALLTTSASGQQATSGYT